MRRQKSENVYIALGSNQGDSVSILRKAIGRLAAFSVEPLIGSSFWETTPVDCPPGSSMFVNAVVRITPPETETPESLLNRLQELEREFGRQPKKVLNEPRPLDLDLIAFGDRAMSSGQLALPHPRAHLRGFVLAPLAEIAPELVLPGQRKTVAQLLEMVSCPGIRRLKVA